MTTSTKELRLERRSRLVIVKKDGRFTLRMTNIRMLDHSDVCLLKEWFLQQNSHINVTLNLRDVTFLPSGFFGMLHDQVDRGVTLSLANVTPTIQEQLWFKQFIGPTGLFTVTKKPWMPYERNEKTVVCM